MSTGVQRYLDVYYQADDSDWREGKDYYTVLRRRLALRSELTGLTLEQLAGAFAALSPGVSEHLNYVSLDGCIRQVTGKTLDSRVRIVGYRRNVYKAIQILTGQSPEVVLRGPKVRAFYHNIVCPASEDVTVDGHMLNIWLNRRGPIQGLKVTRQQFAQAKADMLEASSGTSLGPPQFQATVWLVWKRLNRILYRAQRRLWTPEFEEALCFRR